MRKGASSSAVACAAGGRGGLTFLFLPMACGCCPASGRGSLRGWRQGAGACAAPCPLQPRTPRWGSHPWQILCLPGTSPCHLPVARQRAIVLPLSRAGRGPSVRPASELPPLRGGDLLRALPRLRLTPLFATQSFPAGTALSARRKNGFPPADSVHCAGRTRYGKKSS